MGAGIADATLEMMPSPFRPGDLMMASPTAGSWYQCTAPPPWMRHQPPLTADGSHGSSHHPPMNRDIDTADDACGKKHPETETRWRIRRAPRILQFLLDDARHLVH
jgi:hypothetical protein